jgi:hypothetical protein
MRTTSLLRVVFALVLVASLAAPSSAAPLPPRLPRGPVSPTHDVRQRALRAAPATRSLGYQVGAMQADVALAFGDPAFEGTVTLTLTVGEAGLTELYFYVYDDSTVHGALVDGVPVAPESWQGTIVLSDLSLAPGDHTLTLGLGGDLPCDSGDLMGDVCSFSTDTRYFFMLGWVVPIFFDDVSYLLPRGTVTVHLPAAAAGLTAVSDGVLVDQGADPAGPVATFDYQSEMATYAVFFGHYQSFEGQFEDVPVRCVLSDAHAFFGEDCVAVTKDVLQFHSERYGAYGHASLQIIDAGPIVAGGYGAPANVILNGQIFDYVDYSFIPVVAHEIGHQWWGSYVSFTGPASIPLTEGLAELSACAYQEDRLGDAHCLAREGAAYQGGVGPEDDLPLTSPGVTYDGGNAALLLIYDKSPVVLDLVRRAVGDEAFFGVLGDLVAAGPADRTADEVWSALEAQVGTAKVEAHVKPWFEQVGYPVVSLATGFDDAGAPVLRATQATNAPFGLLLPVAFDVDDQPVALELLLDRASPASAPLPDLSALPTSLEVNAGRTSLVRQVPSPTGDADHDGWVGGFDLLLLARAYQMTAYDEAYQAGNPFYSDAADANGDGTIDEQDLQALVAAFGKKAP